MTSGTEMILESTLNSTGIKYTGRVQRVRKHNSNFMSFWYHFVDLVELYRSRQVWLKLNVSKLALSQFFVYFRYKAFRACNSKVIRDNKYLFVNHNLTIFRVWPTRWSNRVKFFFIHNLQASRKPIKKEILIISCNFLVTGSKRFVPKINEKLA